MAGQLCEIHQSPRQRNGVCSKCYFRSWYESHRDDVIVRVAQWKRENPSATRAMKRQSRARHADTYRQTVRRRRAMIARVEQVPYTESEVYALHGWRCYLCGDPLDVNATGTALPTFDHVIPISRGGADSLDNVRPCHQGCNSRKGRKFLDEMDALPALLGPVPCQGCRKPVTWNGHQWCDPTGPHRCER